MTKQEVMQKVTDMLRAEMKGQAVSKSLVENCINCYTKVMQEEIANNGLFQIFKFGTFKVSERKEHQGRNPQTGETMTIPAHKVIKFTPSQSLKDSL